MPYKRARVPRLIAGTVVAALLASMIAGRYWGHAKEAYFDRVFGICLNAGISAGPLWTDPQVRGVGWLDAEAREFIARNVADRATIACTERWAGWIIDDDPAGTLQEPRCSLTVIVSGQHTSPPGHDVTIWRKACDSPAPD